jgi:hypothetical protein
MADPIVPIIPSLTYGEAIGRAIPVIQQQQQFSEQQRQRLEAERRQREQLEYKRSKELQKEYNQQRESLSDLKNKGNYNDAELAVINFITEDYKQSPDNAELFGQIVTEAEQYTAMFDSFHDAMDKRQSEYEAYTFGEDELGNGLKWNGTIETLNNEVRLISNGGFDYNNLSRDKETNEIIAPYYDAKLDENGNPQYLRDENGQVIKGSILKAPYYQLDSNNMFSIAANTGQLAERNAGKYLQENLGDLIKSYNDNTDLNPEEKRQGLKDYLTRSFNTYETLDENGKEAYHTALKEYKLENYANNPGQQLTDEEKALAVSQYIDRAVGLYQPKVSDVDKEIAYSDFFEAELLSSWNRINAQDISKSQKEQDWNNLLDQRLSDPTLFSSNVNYTRLSNTATTIWEQQNKDNALDSDAKDVAIRDMIKQNLLYIAPTEFSTRKSTATQSEIAKRTLKNNSLSSAADIMEWDGDPNALAENFSAKDFGITGFSQQSIIPLSSMSIPQLNLNNYIGDELKKKKQEGEWVFDESSGEFVKQEDTYGDPITIKSSPNTMRLLMGDDGLIYIGLSDWSSGGVDNKPIDEIYINASATGTSIWQNLNSALKKAMGVGIPELISEFNKM